jgi:serine/threonine-protein kinase
VFQAGSVIAEKYRVEKVLGRGGMGTVIAATHLHLRTQVAIKFLTLGPSDQTVEARFLREARAAARLRSEYVCRVLDFGVEHGVAYMVMEHLEGEDLSRALSNGPLAIGTAATYVMQACHGLAEAHAVGIVHRDLKPGNLFLTHRPDGEPMIKVLDFGVAKLIGESLELTERSQLVGSLGYMSPEQLKSSRQVDARSDIWALGVILYRLVSRRLPFPADAMSDLVESVTRQPPRPLPEATPELLPVIERCLEKDPARRFPTATALADALAPLATSSAPPLGVSIASTPPHERSLSTATAPGTPARVVSAAITAVYEPVAPVAAQVPAHARARWLLLLGAFGLVAIVIVAIAVTRHRGGDQREVASPTVETGPPPTAPAAAPVVQPAEPPAAAAVDAGLETPDPAIAAAQAPAAPKPVRRAPRHEPTPAPAPAPTKTPRSAPGTGSGAGSAKPDLFAPGTFPR